ncbi:MAG: UvrD-helicase domain-containing protein [Aeromicrobium sp.]
MTRYVDDETHLCELFGIPFSPEQLAAITAPHDGPSLISAGAGSGKTTVMAARVVWVVGHHGIAPGRVLGLTFTKKAAAELGQRVRAGLLGMGDARAVAELFDAEGEPTVSTYHAFAGALIDEHGLRLGIEPGQTVETDALRFQRAARVVRRYRGSLPSLTTKLTATVERVLALDANLSEHLVSLDELRAFDRRTIDAIDRAESPTADVAKARAVARERLDLADLVAAYRDDKKFAGVMDFSDQMAWGAALALQRPEVGELLRERFHVVLLDEYQDTSVTQRKMLQGLFSGPDAEHGRGHPLSAVGDPAQAIYGWRGASSDNMAHFREHFPPAFGAAAPVFGLRVSRRCHPDVLAIANRVAEPFYSDFDGLDPLSAPAGDAGTADITVARHLTVSEEFSTLVDQVVEARLANPAEEIAVLLRRRAEMARLTAALRARGVDAEVVGLAGLLSLPHVVDVVSLLELTADATANPAMLRLLAGERFRIGPRDLALLGDRAGFLARAVQLESDETLAGRLSDAVAGVDPTEIVSLSDAVEDPGLAEYSDEARARFAEVARILRTMRQSTGSSVADRAGLAIRLLDLDIETRLLGTGAADDLAALVDVAGDVGGREGTDSLVGFLAYLRAEDEQGQGLEVPARARPGAVQVLTIHAAKGLEWDRVFLPFVVGGQFPSAQGRDRWTSNPKGFPYPLRGDANVLPVLQGWTRADLQDLIAGFQADEYMEEVRLGYVACTRARRALHLSGHWWGRDQKNPLKPSTFLETMHEGVRELGHRVLVWAEPPSGPPNPELQREPIAWPRPPGALPARRAAAELVRAAIATGAATEPRTIDRDAESTILAELDAEIEALRAGHDRLAAPLEIELPAALSTTSVLGLVADADAFARQLARPMPRQPSAAARLGTRFHAWVEAHYGQQVLLDPTDLPGRGDVDLASDLDLADVIDRFRAGPYGDLSPVAIEAPFSIVLAGQQVVGRIDAVFRDGDRWEVVDWKTNRSASADPLQLAVYRLAWAEMNGLDPSDVRGAFYYVRLGEVQRFGDLPGRPELERLVLEQPARSGSPA